jgi:iron complex outermembrane recepter protein
MRVGQVSASVWLVWTVALAASLVGVLPSWAQEERESGELFVLSDELSIQPSDLSSESPASSTEIPPLSDFEQPATTVTDWIAQIEASRVQITNVRVETTEAGLQVILETAEGSLNMSETRSVGNALIADIANATIAEDFSQAEPIEGIALVSVTELPDSRVRVAITGTNAPPVAEVTAEAQGLVLAVMLGDADAAAEEDAIQVVVTGEQDEGYNPSNTSVGTRTDTPLRDIPQSIQIVPQEVLRDQNVTNFNEAVKNVPGVSPTNPSTNEIASFNIRGFSVGDFNSNNILRNGLREAGILEIVSNPDIERIEVLRGPASVLYGGANPGGIINLVTEQPLRDPFYAVDATIGNYDFYRGAIDLSGPLNDSRTILYRLNAGYQNSGSFVDFVELERFTIAPVVSFAIGERTRLTVEGEYIDRDQVLNSGLPAEGTLFSNPNGRIPRNRFLGEPDGILYYIQARAGYRLEHQFSDNWSLQNTFQWKTARVSSTDRIFSATSLDADNRTLNGDLLDIYAHTDIYDLNLNLTGRFATGSIGHQLTLGVDLGRYDRNDDLLLAPAASIDVFNPVYGQPATGAFAPVFVANRLTDTLGIYIQDQVTLTENLKLLLGGRFDLFRQTEEDFLAETSTRQSGDAFNPRVGIVYQPIQPISLYASYSRSFTPAIGTAFDGGVFQPERGTQYEIGVKADVTDQLSATLALYELTRTNVLTDDTRPGIPPGFSIQTGEQRSRGAELSIQGEILPGWNILAGYAYTNAEITEDNTLPEGNRLANVPENAFNLWTTYEIQSGDLQGLGFGLGLFFVGEREGDLDNTFQFPSYLRTDAAIFYRRNQFRVGLNIRNLFDIDYFETSFGRLRVFPGEPFTVQGTISWQF